MREFDWSLIPGPAFETWEQASFELRNSVADGRHVEEARLLAIDAIERSDLNAPEWTDVVDTALRLLEVTPSDSQAAASLSRVAAEHWNNATRDRAEAILETWLDSGSLADPSASA
jgi:hypothetical protein